MEMTRSWFWERKEVGRRFLSSWLCWRLKLKRKEDQSLGRTHYDSWTCFGGIKWRDLGSNPGKRHNRIFGSEEEEGKSRVCLNLKDSLPIYKSAIKRKDHVKRESYLHSPAASHHSQNHTIPNTRPCTSSSRDRRVRPRASIFHRADDSVCGGGRGRVFLVWSQQWAPSSSGSSKLVTMTMPCCIVF